MICLGSVSPERDSGLPVSLIPSKKGVKQVLNVGRLEQDFCGAVVRNTMNITPVHSLTVCVTCQWHSLPQVVAQTLLGVQNKIDLALLSHRKLMVDQRTAIH